MSFADIELSGLLQSIRLLSERSPS
jgi:hypothetical protein